MKKSDSIDFTIPQRQSYVAILLIIWSTYKIIFRQAIPILVIVFLGQSDSRGTRILWGVIIVAVLSMIYSIISFFKFRFYLKGSELVIEQGIFTKKVISIDIDRVQTINFEQNLLHKAFNVARLKADTAGSGKEEFSLDAIDKQVGEELRNIVLQLKKESIPSIELNENEDDTTYSIKDKLIFKLGIKELLIAGTVENHIRSGGLILAFFFYIYTNLSDVGIHVEDYTDEIGYAQFTITLILILFIVISIVSFLISMVRMAITYYDLKLVRTGNGFNYTAGLFTKRAVSALDKKIQKITWSDNLLKKIIGIFDLKFEQAGSEEIKEKKSIKIPSCKIEHIEAVLADLFPDFNKNSIQLQRINNKWLQRQLLFRLLFGLLVTLIGLYLSSNVLILGIFILTLLPLHAYLRYKKARFGFDEQYFFIKGGIYGDKNTVFPIYKLQAVKRMQSPYMRRKGLVSLTFHHASGSSHIPYITEQQARQIIDFTLFKIEISDLDWM